MKKLHWTTFEGNARYEGFCVDLLTKLSEYLGFDFELYVVSDGKYGEQIDETSGKWDGMIGELLNKASARFCNFIVSVSRDLFKSIFRRRIWRWHRSQ